MHFECFIILSVCFLHISCNSVFNFADWTSAYLVISNRRSILVANLNTTTLERVPVRVENVVATASEMSTGTIYWSDMVLKKIFRLTKGGEPEVVSNVC